MKRMYLFLVFALMLGSLFWLFGKGLGNDPQRLDFAVKGQEVPDFRLPDLRDTERMLDRVDLPDSGMYLLNVWGSWCATCYEEHAFLLKLSKTTPIVGINWQDEVSAARRFIDEKGNPYQNIISDKHGVLALALGVSGAPETFLVRDSVLVARHTGLLTPEVWQTVFVPMLEQKP